MTKTNEIDFDELRILLGYLQHPELTRDYYPRLDGRLIGKLPVIAQALEGFLAKQESHVNRKKPCPCAKKIQCGGRRD